MIVTSGQLEKYIAYPFVAVILEFVMFIVTFPLKFSILIPALTTLPALFVLIVAPSRVMLIVPPGGVVLSP